MLVILFFLIAITIAYITVKAVKSPSSQSYQPTTSYYSKNYRLKCLSSKGSTIYCDTTKILEVWAKDSYYFVERQYIPDKSLHPLMIVRKGTDSLYMFFANCDTVYAIPDTTIVGLIPSVPYNVSRQILEDSSAKLPSTFTIENMELCYYKKEKGKTILSYETFIWVNPTAHLAAYRTVTIDSVSRRELWSWQVWNVDIPDSVFVLPNGMLIIVKNKDFYDSLVPFSDVKVIRKKQTAIPSVHMLWIHIKMHLRNLFDQLRRNFTKSEVGQIEEWNKARNRMVRIQTPRSTAMTACMRSVSLAAI